MTDTVAGMEPARAMPRGRPFVKKAGAELSAAAVPSSPALLSDAPPVVSGGPSLQAPQRRRTVNPFGALVQKLAYPPRSGYHQHWFNDDENRIGQAKEGGYEHVTSKNGTPVSRRVGTTKAGGVLNAYLMEIPQEWYEEDMAAQQAEVDKREAGYKRGADDHGQPGIDGRYLPSRGITIRTV
jgi:hypothetical protein